MLFRTAYLAPLFCITTAFADEAEVRPVFGAHPGYLFNVVEERNKRDIEMVMLPKPKPPPKPISKVIFNEKLTKEFQDQYRYRFGTTEAEEVINNPGRDSEYVYYNRPNITLQEYQYQQQQFGNYMVRRLTEYHFDNWAKSDPDFRPVYKAKDKYSNADVKVAGGYKIKWKYNFAGPSMEATVENPYDIEIRSQVIMGGIISTPHEVIHSVGYNLNPRWKIEALYRQYQQLSQLVLTRKLNKHVNLTLTGSSGQLPSDSTIWQNLALVGFSYHE